MKDILTKLLAEPKETPNILDPCAEAFEEDKKQLFVAPQRFRQIAQNIIDNIAEHRHLKKAKVLLLIRCAESVAKKLNDGERVVLGKAAKADAKIKLLSTIDGGRRADFVIWLSGDWLEGIGAAVSEDREFVCCDDDAAMAKVVALIDHELLHCGAKIAGEFIAADNLDGFVQDLGISHLETCRDISRDDGSVLVRYYFSDGTGDHVFQMRKHDVEEFTGVVDRHGPWDTQLGRLIDVLVKNEETLFSGTKK